MRKWLSVAIATVLLPVVGAQVGLGAPAASQHASAKQVAQTYVTHNCSNAKIEPRRIIFSCPDGDFWVQQMTWSKWQKKRARGHGHFRVNEGETTIKRKGRLTLLRRQWCADEDQFVYQKARIRYREPVEGRRRVSVDLSCPK